MAALEGAVLTALGEPREINSSRPKHPLKPTQPFRR